MTHSSLVEKMAIMIFYSSAKIVGSGVHGIAMVEGLSASASDQCAEDAFNTLCQALGCTPETLEGVASGEMVIVRRDNILRLHECGGKVIEYSTPPAQKDMSA